MTVASRIGVPRLSSGSAERVVVVAIGLLWLVLIAPLPRSLDGTGWIIAVLLLALDLALGILTDWLALTPTWNLDERLTAIRDQAYRSAFRCARWGFALLFLGAYVNIVITSFTGGGGPGGVTLRSLLAILEMLLILPTAVLAWEGWASGTVSRPAFRRAGLALLVAPAVLIAWAAMAALLPVRTVVVRPTNISFELTGANCSQYLVEKEVAAGLDGAVGFHAEVCWNGHKAFSVGDPGLPLPSDVLPHQEVMPPGGLDDPQLTACTPGNVETDFASVSETCEQSLDGSSGTMTLIARGRVSPLPGGFGTRTLEVRLVIRADGRLVSVS